MSENLRLELAPRATADLQELLHGAVMSVHSKAVRVPQPSHDAPMEGDFPSPAPPAEALPRLSVIIPVRDSASLLAEQLQALTEQSWDDHWEVIVVDDGSRDDPAAVLARYANGLPDARLLHVPRSLGAAHARNVGAEAAKGPWLAFIDADDVIAPGWIAAIGRALQEHAVVVSRFDSAKLNAPELQSTRTLAQEQGLATYRRPEFLPHAGGCGLAVHRSVHEAIDGFDEGLKRLEDTDYCWRLQLAGHELHYQADALVHIRFRDTVRKSFWQAFGYGRYDGRLYHRYRRHGMPRSGIHREALQGVRDMIEVLRARGRVARIKRLRSLGNRLGRLLGRIEGLWHS